MKKFIASVIALCGLLTATYATAQLTKGQIKERKELMKMSKKSLNEKATKAARKEAKQLKKDGWVVSPGALPLEKQLDRSYLMQQEYEADMSPRYFMADGMSIGTNYDAAKQQAIELAKQSLAGQIATEINALIENSVSNNQLGAEEATSLTKTITASSNVIYQKLGRIVPVVEAYRVLSNKNREVLVRIAYSNDLAKKAAAQVLSEQLADETEAVRAKLDAILGH
ncbi:MAG: hypothetical protein NC098_08545 [Lachnoclostridium sp.]|nr:hypothetical protein [Lachnoclostridium sp.]